MASSACETFMLPGCNVPLRAVPERRPWTRQRRGVVLIINEAHRDRVLAIKAGRSGE